jgi:hypothetical protein
MKHHLKPGVVAALAAAAALAGAGPAAAATPTSDSATQTATADVASTLSASLPTGSLDLDLGPGSDSTTAQAITVRSNDKWGLRIFADQASLTKWEQTAYVADEDLSAPLMVQLDAGTATAVPQAATIAEAANTKTVTGTDARAAGDAGIAVAATFSQAFSYADAPGAYRAVVTYAVDQAF